MPTKQEIAQKYGGVAVAGDQSSIAAKYGGVPVATTTAKPLTPVDEKTNSFYDNIKESFKSRTDRLSEGYLRQMQGKQSFGESALQSVGQAIGMAGEAAFGAVAAITPQAVKDAIGSAGKAVVDNPVGQAGVSALVQGLGSYQKWKDANPRWADDFEATLNIASALPVGKAGQVAGKGIKKTAQAVATPIAKTAQKIVAPVKSKIENKLTTELAKKYREVGSALVRQKKILNNADSKGRDLGKILAERNIVPEVKNGKMATAAVADNFKADIDPLNEYLDDALKQIEPSIPRVSLEEIEQVAIQRAKSKSNIAANKSGTIVNQLKKEFAEYRANYGDSVSVSQLNEIKRGKWSVTKFEPNAPYLKGDSDYIIGRVAKDTIEQKIPKEMVDVHEFNDYIGQLYDAEKFLRSLDGHAVKGGRLGTYTGRVIGTIVGTKLPFPVGGEIAGMIGGGMVADILQKNTFSNGMKQIVLRGIAKRNPEALGQILQFLKQSKLEQSTRLRLPAPSFISGQPWKGGFSGKIKAQALGQSILKKQPLTRLMLPAKGQTGQGASSPILSVPKNKEYVGGQQWIGGASYPKKEIPLFKKKELTKISQQNIDNYINQNAKRFWSKKVDDAVNNLYEEDTSSLQKFRFTNIKEGFNGINIRYNRNKISNNIIGDNWTLVETKDGQRIPIEIPDEIDTLDKTKEFLRNELKKIDLGTVNDTKSNSFVYNDKMESILDDVLSDYKKTIKSEINKQFLNQFNKNEKSVVDDIYKAWAINKETPHGYGSNSAYRTALFKIKSEYINSAIEKLNKLKSSKIKSYVQNGITYFKVGDRQVSFHGNYKNQIGKLRANLLQGDIWIGSKTKKNPLEMDKKEYENLRNFNKKQKTLERITGGNYNREEFFENQKLPNYFKISKKAEQLSKKYNIRKGELLGENLNRKKLINYKPDSEKLINEFYKKSGINKEDFRYRFNFFAREYGITLGDKFEVFYNKKYINERIDENIAILKDNLFGGKYTDSYDKKISLFKTKTAKGRLNLIAQKEKDQASLKKITENKNRIISVFNEIAKKEKEKIRLLEIEDKAKQKMKDWIKNYFKIKAKKSPKMATL